MRKPAREWDGTTYDRISAPMERMGRAVLDRLELRGNERVLDAGCGSGRVTEALVARLPEGHVIGVDGSADMIEAARRRLGPSADLRVANLLDLDLGPAGPVDHVLSTATFHWIGDHPRLFERLRLALRAGGRLVAQCGGTGNVDAVHAAARAVGAAEPFAEHLDGWVGPWNFAGPQETEERLLAAGFREARCWLHEEPVEPDDPATYLRTIVLGAHLERLPAGVADAFVAGVVDRLVGSGCPVTIDYVRLNILAVA